MDRLVDLAHLNGWMPVRFYCQDGVPAIDWCYLGNRSFHESSFEQTVEACLRFPANLLFRHQTSIEVLRELSETRPGLPPTGFIFHMSRSVATPVSRIIAATPENIVISEARPIDAVLRAHLRDEKVSDVERIDWLRWLLSALGEQRMGIPLRYFIIFNCWNVLELPLIRRAFPDVPWAFVYRDPLEALVSQLEQRGPETIPSVFQPGYFGMEPDAATVMEPEEYCATVLAAICGAALRHQPDGGMLINYNQPPEVIGSLISDFFGVRCGVAGHHNSGFDPQNAMKQRRTWQRLHEAATRLLYPLYEQLEALRLT